MCACADADYREFLKYWQPVLGVNMPNLKCQRNEENQKITQKYQQQKKRRKQTDCKCVDGPTICLFIFIFVSFAQWISLVSQMQHNLQAWKEEEEEEEKSCTCQYFHSLRRPPLYTVHTLNTYVRACMHACMHT